MKTSRGLAIATTAIVTLLLLPACKSRQCRPRQQIPCACNGEQLGIQECDERGQRYGACVCPEAPPPPSAILAPELMPRSTNSSFDPPPIPPSAGPR